MLPLPFPAADVDRCHGHTGEGPSHGHLPLLLRQCSQRGLWDNDLPNEGGGFSSAGIAAQFRLPDAVGPWRSESVAFSWELSCVPQDPLCCHKSISRQKHWQGGGGSNTPESSIRPNRRILCPSPRSALGSSSYIHFAGKFVTASGLLESEEVSEIGLLL